ncbi:MAG TPA: hypothetical protein PKN27_06430 [Propionibacteriaceae bacterium]|nr:hypothetical protein [Propionibacteriaceae bacterium]
MVGTLVRLQLKLFGRGVRGNVGKLIGLVITGLWIAGVVLALSAGLILLRGHPADERGGAGVLVFSALALVWPMLTLISSGADQTLDPGRFALFPLRARDLMPGLLVVGVLGSGGLTASALALAYLYSWSSALVPAVAALVGGTIGVLTVVVVSRALTSLFAQGMATRRYRDFSASALAMVVIASVVAMQFIQKWVGTDPSAMLRRVAGVSRILAWTPMGWAWALPWDAAEGRWGHLVLRGTLAVGMLALGWRVWRHTLDVALVSPLESGGGGGKVKASGWIDRVLPHGPVGAIGARSLKYWRRDPRHVVNVLGALLLPLLMILPMLINPLPGQSLREPWVLMYPVLGSMLMSASSVASEITYDGSALWTQIVAPIRGRDDRLGRLVGLLAIFVPATIFTDLVFLALTGQWRYTVPLLSAGLGSLAAATAVGTLVGSWWQFAVPPPGSSPFAKGSGGGAVSVLSALACMAGSIALSMPFIAVALLAAWQPWLGWVALGMALGVGPAIIWGAAHIGGRRLDATWPEVLKRVTYESS